MIDTVLRFLTFSMVAAGLLAVNLFAVRAIGKIWFDRGATIMPFKIIGGDQVLGPAMATLLQARLAELQRQLQQVQLGLTQPELGIPRCSPAPAQIGSEPHDDEGKPAPPMPTIQLVSAPVPTALFEPLDLSVSVAGVNVGSLLGWMQRAVISSRVIQFTVSFSNGDAVVAGDLSPLTGKRGGVWLETKQLPAPQIADLLAHKLIAAAANDDNLAALSAEGFQALTRTLGAVAELNRRAARGAAVREEFSAKLPGLMALTQAAPRWLDLLYFTASVAESAGDNTQALILYERLRSELSRSPASAERRTSATSEQVESKLKNLRSAPPTGFFDDIALRLLAVTGLFEFGSKEPAKLFGTVMASSDRDILFGVAWWSLRRGSLVPLLRQMRATKPQRFYEIVGRGAEAIDRLLDCDATASDTFLARTVRDGRLDPDWQMRFSALGAEPEFQKVQVATLEPFFRRAIGLADQWELRSEQGLAQMFDLVFFRGGMPKKAGDALTAQIQKIRNEERREPSEQERMNLIAHELAANLPRNTPFTPSQRFRTLYFGDPTKSERDGFPSLEELGLTKKPFRAT